jgi:hypothetical protein
MRFTQTLVALVALFSASSGAIALSETDRHAASLCEAATRKAEFSEKLPRGLLEAISLKETGRWDGAAKRSYPWPWTVTSGGDGVHFATRAEALARVRALMEKGIKNIDVDCMQINMRYHPHAFESLEEAFDPTKNTAYAAAHLSQLHEDHRSWYRAVERYHSSDPKRGPAYRKAVYKLVYAATKTRRVTALETAQSTWKERATTQRGKYEAAKKARLKLVRDIRKTKTSQEKQRRLAFEERRVRVFERWEKMMKKRRASAKGKRS